MAQLEGNSSHVTVDLHLHYDQQRESHLIHMPTIGLSLPHLCLYIQLSVATWLHSNILRTCNLNIVHGYTMHAFIGKGVNIHCMHLYRSASTLYVYSHSTPEWVILTIQHTLMALEYVDLVQMALEFWLQW